MSWVQLVDNEGRFAVRDARAAVATLVRRARERGDQEATARLAMVLSDLEWLAEREDAAEAERRAGVEGAPPLQPILCRH